MPSDARDHLTNKRLSRSAPAALCLGVPVVTMAASTLIASGLTPSATLMNQFAALAGWGVAAAVAVSAGARPSLQASGIALILYAATAGVCLLAQGLPGSMAASTVGVSMAALLVSGTATGAGRAWSIAPTMRPLAVALLVAGLGCTLIAFIQVFVPGWADGGVISRSSFPGRAVGNLRQPNHLSTVLLWGAIGAAWVSQRSGIAGRLTLGLYTLLIAAIVLTASRTGLVGVLLLALWGLVDRQLNRPTRLALIAAPLIYALCWWLFSTLAHHGGPVFGGEERMQLHGDGDLSSSRFAIWSNTLALIAANPWFGVGVGGFNFAWTLTTFPDRPTAFFDHTHNLLLQMWVELGLPLGTLVLSLLAYAYWRAFAAARSAVGEEAAARRAAFMVVTMAVLHSQFEYPLWYAHFLLPTAFALGICLAQTPSDKKSAPSSGTAGWTTTLSSPISPRSAPQAGGTPRDETRLARLSRYLGIAAGLAIMAGSLYALHDYRKVSVIYNPPPGAAPLHERIAIGQRSLFFAHHADYAAITTAQHPGTQLEAGLRAAHNLLDTRLMIALAKAYAERGDLDRARTIAARLREFRLTDPQGRPRADAIEFFAACDRAPSAAPEAAMPTATLPFQCQAPTRSLGYRDFK